MATLPKPSLLPKPTNSGLNTYNNNISRPGTAGQPLPSKPKPHISRPGLGPSRPGSPGGDFNATLTPRQPLIKSTNVTQSIASNYNLAPSNSFGHCGVGEVWNGSSCVNFRNMITQRITSDYTAAARRAGLGTSNDIYRLTGGVYPTTPSTPTNLTPTYPLDPRPRYPRDPNTGTGWTGGGTGPHTVTDYYHPPSGTPGSGDPNNPLNSIAGLLEHLFGQQQGSLIASPAPSSPELYPTQSISSGSNSGMLLLVAVAAIVGVGYWYYKKHHSGGHHSESK